MQRASDGLQPLALCLELLLALLGAEQGEGAASLPDLQVFDLWTKSFIDLEATAKDMKHGYVGYVAICGHAYA